MNKEIREQWTAALRSGEYKQGIGFLRDRQDNYCCLGVLCDLTKELTGQEWSKPNSTWLFGDSEDDISSSVLTCHVSDVTGLSDLAGKFNLFGEYGNGDFDTALTTLNDEGFTFAQIADVIDYFFSE